MKLPTVWDERYSVRAAHTNSTLKQAQVVHAALDEELLDIRDVPFDSDATWTDIARVHAAEYACAVRTGVSRALAESQGFDWSPALAESVALIWNETDRLFYKVARGPEEYRRHLRRLPAMLDRFEPDLVQYQAGMDCHEHDHMGGIDGIDEAFLAERDRFVIEEVVAKRISLVINLAGGYEGMSEGMHVTTARIALEVTGGQ